MQLDEFFDNVQNLLAQGWGTKYLGRIGAFVKCIDDKVDGGLSRTQKHVLKALRKCFLTRLLFTMFVRGIHVEKGFEA